MMPAHETVGAGWLAAVIITIGCLVFAVAVAVLGGDRVDGRPAPTVEVGL